MVSTQGNVFQCVGLSGLGRGTTPGSNSVETKKNVLVGEERSGGVVCLHLGLRGQTFQRSKIQFYRI